MLAITDLVCAETPEQYAELNEQFRAEQAGAPSDAEVLTGFLRDCTDLPGNPLVKSNEFADLTGDGIVIRAGRE